MWYEMRFHRMSVLLIFVAGLSACNSTTLTGPAFPDREHVSFLSADGTTVRSYACERRANAGRAHRYTDGAILEAQRRFTRESGGGIASGLGVRAEVNAEISRISRNIEADYRCAYVGSQSRNESSKPFLG